MLESISLSPEVTSHLSVLVISVNFRLSVMVVIIMVVVTADLSS